LIIDGWEEFAAASEAGDHGVSVDRLVDAARRARSVGLTVLATGDRGLLQSRLMSCATDVFVLHLADRNDYALAGIDVRRVTAPMPPGRARHAPDGDEVHFATVAASVNPYADTDDPSAVRMSP